MNEDSNDLWQELSVMADAFGDLGRAMLHASRMLHAPGLMPSRAIDEQLIGLRLGFASLRERSCRLAAGLGLTVPAADELNSLKAVAALLDLVSEAESRRAERDARGARAVAVLDRVLRLEHTQDPSFAPLAECQDRAKTLRLAIVDGPFEDVAEQVAGLVEMDHPFAYLISLVEGVDQISDDLWDRLFESICNAFGRPLSAAVARAKIVERAAAIATVADPLPVATETDAPVARVWPAADDSDDTAVDEPDELLDSVASETLSYFPKSFSALIQRRRLGRAARHKTVPSMERLETVRLLAANVISGFVYLDGNDNGLFEKGETPIAADTINLVNAAGTVVGTATTDASGAYSFSTDSTVNTAPLTKTQTVTVPATLTNFSQTLSLAQFDPSQGNLFQVDIRVDGSLTSSISAENTSASSPATITSLISGTLALTAPGGVSLSAPLSQPGTSFDASTYDGKTDFAGTSGHDFGAQSASVSDTLTLSTARGDDLGGFIGTGNLPASFAASATSTARGGGNLMVTTSSAATATITITYHYRPDNALPPGDYKIVQVTEPPDTLNGLDSSNGTVLPFNPGPGPDTISVHVPVSSQGTTLPNNDFGELMPAQVSGFVYADNNDNGLKDTGEPGIPGIQLTLSGTDDLNHSVGAQTTTGPDGAYDFPGLRPGLYTVTETTEAVGYLRGLATRGNITPLPGSDQTEAIPGISVASGQTAPDNDFGKLLPASIRGFVYFDRNANGLKGPNEPGFVGIPVSLTGTNDLHQPVTESTKTGVGGAFEFTDLRPGTYTLSEPTAPKGYINGLATEGNVTPIPGSNKTGMIAGITLVPSADSANNDFGKLLPGSPGGQTIGPPPEVLNVFRLGLHHQETTLVIRFSTALDPASATNLANYRLVAASRDGSFSGSPIALASAVYSPATHTVTLTPESGHLNIYHHYQLSISGVKDASGVLLDGNRNGKPGGTYVTVITKNNYPFPLPPAPKPNSVAIARWAKRYPRLAAEWTRTHTPGLPS